MTGPDTAHDQLSILIEGIPQLVWRADHSGQWTWASPQWTAFTGQSTADSRGTGWLDQVHPDDRDGALAVWQSALDKGEFAAEYRIHRASDGAYHWFQTRATAVHDGSAEIVEWLGTSTDVNDLRQLQQRQQLLVAELQHRVRNMLTVVRSVFSLTADSGSDLAEVADHFKGRLDALARTQVVVTQSATGLVDLEDMVRDELLSVGRGDGPGISLAGPEVRLLPHEAEIIGLAVHELTTNAIKYGALRTPHADLAIEWRTIEGYGITPLLIFKWTETGVPAVPLRPSRSGFGRELIEEALPYRLNARTELKFRGGGVLCIIEVPLSRDRDEGAQRGLIA